MKAGSSVEDRGGILYPTMLIAVFALIVFSIVSIAMLTGMLPKALSTPAPAADAQPQAGASVPESAESVESKADPAGAASEPRRPAPLGPARQSAAGSPSRLAGSEPRAHASCANCGRVESVRTVRVSGRGIVAAGQTGKGEGTICTGSQGCAVVGPLGLA